MTDDQRIKVILPAGMIPLGSVVTKRTGEKPYTLVDSVVIYAEPRQEIKASDGTRFIVSDPNEGASKVGINAVGSGTELVWWVTPETLLYWLREQVEGTSQ